MAKTNIKKSYTNAYEKAKTTSYFYELPQSEEGYTRSNPFSGAEVELSALEATIYDFCQNWYSRYSYGMKTEVPVSTFDNMRYYLMALNPSAYYALLD